MKKILILRFSSIGDIVLTSPVVRCLRKQFPQAQIDYVCKSAFAPILQSNPYINNVFHFGSDIRLLVPVLRAEHYDVIIDLHKNLRSWRLRRALGIKTHSFYKANLEKWLMVNFKWDRLPRVHIVDRYMQAVQPLGVNYDGAGLDYFIPPDVTFERAGFDMAVAESFIVLAIGAAHSTKRLPTVKIISICESLSQRIILLGGKNESEAGKTIVGKLGPRVVNLCGKLSIHQSADAIRQSQLVITHDTGMMHIAAAFHKPIISVWGNTIPQFGMTPFYPDGIGLNTTVETTGLGCRPCSKIGHQRCPKGHFKCMESIDTAIIAEVVARALG